MVFSPLYLIEAGSQLHFCAWKIKGQTRAWSVFAREVSVTCRTRWLSVAGIGVRSWLLSVLVFNPEESGSKRNRCVVG